MLEYVVYVWLQPNYSDQGGPRQIPGVYSNCSEGVAEAMRQYPEYRNIHCVYPGDPVPGKPRSRFIENKSKE